MRIHHIPTVHFFTSIILFGLPVATGTILYCSIHFIVDYPLWLLTYTTRADRDYFRTNALLTTYIYRNVEGLNELYDQYRFPYTSKVKNTTIQFFVHGVTVVTQNVCDGKDSNQNQPDNPLRQFCSPNINSDMLLDLIARYGDYEKEKNNHEAACLYYGITSRKLRLQDNKGTALGWSWKGHLCSRLQELSSWSLGKPGFNPRYSGNAGVITASFDASDYSLNKGEMTFFHEIGHSMDANHDNDAEFKDRQNECSPSDSVGGSYLMYSTGTEGLLPNNRAYSHCSLDTISKYTESLARQKPTCLSTSKQVKGRCDGVFSAGELCDEHGTTSTCCTTDCKLKPGALCSPSAGSCCQSSCQFHPSGHYCRRESDCKLAIQCTGTSASCPEQDQSYFKADRTLCRNGTLLCQNGLCQLSVCTLHSLSPCQLKDPADGLCIIACMNKDGSCMPYHTISRTGLALYLPYGSFCNQNQGFCDQSHQCLPLLIDHSTNLISEGFSSLLLTNYSVVIKRYWWTFLLFLLVQIVLIPVVLFYFHSQCIPSDNPFLQADLHK